MTSDCYWCGSSESERQFCSDQCAREYDAVDGPVKCWDCGDTHPRHDTVSLDDGDRALCGACSDARERADEAADAAWDLGKALRKEHGDDWWAL